MELPPVSIVATASASGRRSLATDAVAAHPLEVVPGRVEELLPERRRARRVSAVELELGAEAYALWKSNAAQDWLRTYEHLLD